MEQLLSEIDYYFPIVDLLAILGIISFLALSPKDKKNKINILLATALILVLFYENLALYLASKKISNFWVYLIFFNHLATWLNLMIIREFIFRRNLKNVISGMMWVLLLFSGVPFAVGIIPFDDGGEYSSLLGASFVIFACALFFYELLSNDKYLSINPLQFSGFWISTIMLFFYSGSFMIFISYSYLIENYLNTYYVVIELTRTSALILYFTYFMTLAKRNGFNIDFLKDNP